jgi:hypothetical protein
VHRVLHHRFVDEAYSHPLTSLQANRLGVTQLLVVERPEVPLHVTGETEDHVLLWIPDVGIRGQRP